MEGCKAVFIDRDGVINKEIGRDILTAEDFILEDGSKEALIMLKKSPYKTIVVSNQAKIGRGTATWENIEKMNDMFRDLVDGIYICPHKPEDNCECRKPKPGMLLKAQKEHNITLKESFFVGDKSVDVVAGRNVGCKTILVQTGYAGKDTQGIEPEYTAQNLLDAVKNVIIK